MTKERRARVSAPESRRRRPTANSRGRAAAVGLLGATLWLTGCGDTCKDCPDDARLEYACLGWIAPACGTYCVSGSGGRYTLISDCCCEGGSRAPTSPALRPPLRQRAGGAPRAAAERPATASSPRRLASSRYGD